jgi:broad specificity phosphatase PhoE
MVFFKSIFSHLKRIEHRMKLIFIRHGEAEHNVAASLYGDSA